MEVRCWLPMLVADASGDEFEVSFHPTADGQVDYQWVSVSDPKRKGSGTLFEKYGTVSKTAEGKALKDAGSQLQVEIGDLQMKWSKRSESSGWIYYHPDDLTISQ